MAGPPSFAGSMEGGHQLLKGGDGQNGGLGARFGGEVGAADRDVAEPAGEDLDLAVADMTGKAGEPGELQRPAKEGMGGVGDGDLALAFFGDQGGITSVEVCPSPDCRISARSHAY